MQNKLPPVEIQNGMHHFTVKYVNNSVFKEIVGNFMLINILSWFTTSYVDHLICHIHC